MTLPRNLADGSARQYRDSCRATRSRCRGRRSFTWWAMWAVPRGLLVDNGSLTVLQALALAGGANHTAKMGGARIIRKGPDGMTETKVPLKKMLEAKAPDINLQADDILFVPLSGARVAGRKRLSGGHLAQPRDCGYCGASVSRSSPRPRLVYAATSDSRVAFSADSTAFQHTNIFFRGVAAGKFPHDVFPAILPHVAGRPRDWPRAVELHSPDRPDFRARWQSRRAPPPEWRGPAPLRRRITGRAQDMNSSIFVGITVLNTSVFLSSTRHTSDAPM